jgi:hypothetical protein
MLGTNIQLDNILCIAFKLCDVNGFSIEFTAKVGDFVDSYSFRLVGRHLSLIVPQLEGKYLVVDICDLNDKTDIYDACMIVWKKLIYSRYPRVSNHCN